MYYEIVESDRFTQDRGEIAKDVQRWDEVMHAVTWALSRDPHEAGKRTVVADIYALPTEGAPGVPATVLYYRIHPKQVELLAIRRADDGFEL